jgi:flagella basal body P-ring formation protein FlgA
MSLPLALALTASAASFADLDAIDRAVAGFTGGVSTPVDRRLRLNRCAVPLALSWHSQKRDSVIVQCPDTGGWRLFVPARADAAQGPPAVDRADAVSISVSGDGFSVSRAGEALEAGAVGAWIKVRPMTDTTRPAQPLVAQVVRPGLVIVPLP